MLHSFISAHTDEINNRVAQRLRKRESRGGSSMDAPSQEVSAFLVQVSASLREREHEQPLNDTAISATATRHGANLVRAGRPASEAVQAYGDVCQAVTALAIERHATISAADFSVFNRCLDDAIGNAVGEHARITEEARAANELQRLGHAAHELRDQLHTAQLSFEALRRTTTIVDEPAAALLGRSLMNLSALIERTLADVRLAAGVERRELLPLDAFLQEVLSVGQLHARSRGRVLTLQSTATGAIEADAQLLMSAVMNLVHNALKFTATGGSVSLIAATTAGRLILSVEDQCGGIPESTGELFRSFDDRRGIDRTGMGLGLSIARKVIRFHGGDIEVRNRPGVGCVFTIDMPMVAAARRSAARASAS